MASSSSIPTPPRARTAGRQALADTSVFSKSTANLLSKIKQPLLAQLVRKQQAAMQRPVTSHLHVRTGYPIWQVSSRLKHRIFTEAVRDRQHLIIPDCANDVPKVVEVCARALPLDVVV